MHFLLTKHFINIHDDDLEDFLLEGEAELVTLGPKDPGKGGVTTEEDGDLAHPLLLDLGEDLVPVRTSSISTGLQASHKITFFLK